MTAPITPTRHRSPEPLREYSRTFESALTHQIHAKALQRLVGLNDTVAPMHMHVEQHVKAGWTVPADQSGLRAPGGGIDKRFTSDAVRYAGFLQQGKK